MIASPTGEATALQSGSITDEPRHRLHHKCSRQHRQRTRLAHLTVRRASRGNSDPEHSHRLRRD
jgi:hypothetical protein